MNKSGKEPLMTHLQQKQHISANVILTSLMDWIEHCSFTQPLVKRDKDSLKREFVYLKIDVIVIFLICYVREF